MLPRRDWGLLALNAGTSGSPQNIHIHSHLFIWYLSCVEYDHVTRDFSTAFQSVIITVYAELAPRRGFVNSVGFSVSTNKTIFAIGRS